MLEQVLETCNYVVENSKNVIINYKRADELIEENSEYEVEVRASMIIVVNYIWERINKSIDRIDINDFIWYKGQDKSKEYKLYHLTRTTSY